MADTSPQSRIKDLIAKGKEQGYLTYAEVNDHLPDDISDPDQVEDIIQMINDMGIQVFESAPDADTLLMSDSQSADEVAAEEAAAALAAVETEAGRTTDPVRMYMREMGTVELLTREGEIVIAKRIEEGTRELMAALASYPGVVSRLLEEYQSVATEQRRLADLLTGYLDPMDTSAPPEPTVAASESPSTSTSTSTSPAPTPPKAMMTRTQAPTPVQTATPMIPVPTRSRPANALMHCVRNTSKPRKQSSAMAARANKASRRCWRWARLSSTSN